MRLIYIYCDTGFYSGQTSYLSMKVLTFAKDRFFSKPLLIIDTSVTTQTSSELAALEPCIKAKIGSLLLRSYNFLVADW